MERSTSSGKEKEFAVTVLAGTGRIFQKMLSNSRVMGDSLRGVCLAGTGRIRAVIGRMMISDRPGNVLLNAFFQPLISTTECRIGTQIDIVMGR